MDELNTMEEILKCGDKELRDVTWAALQELDRACIKFPTWPTLLTNHDSENVTGVIKRLRKINDGKGYAETWLVSADTIIMEELAETLEAAQKGDLEVARKECVQAMAMLLRLYIHLPYYCTVRSA
jgi:hypothetical protein